MSAVDEVVADWVPWSTGDAARYRTKAEAVTDLLYRLAEAGFVIVPRVANDAMANAGFQHTGDPCWPEDVKEAWSSMIAEWQRSEGT